MTTRVRKAVGLSLAALLMTIPAAASGQASGLKIVGPAKLTLDPRCNARSGVQFLTQLRNDGAGTVPLALTAAEPVAKTAGKLALLNVTIVPVDAAGKPAARTSLAKDEGTAVHLDLKGTLESGEWEIEIRNAGATVGKIAVSSPPAVFGVKLDGPDNPEIVMERGRPATIAVKNDDGYGHQLSARLTIRGVALNAQREISLPPGGGGEFAFMPSADWFPRGVIANLMALFRDDAADARLTVRSLSPACFEDPATPTQLFKMKATLAAHPVANKDFRWNVALLITLLLGGICSLALNFLLPAYTRQFRARSQLSRAMGQIEDLPASTDARVRASIGVERRQLADRLSRLKLYGGSTEMTEIERGLARLQTRLELLAQMDLVLNRYWRQRSGGLLLIVSEEIDELKRQLDDLLRRPSLADSDIQTVQALVKKMEDRLKNATAADAELAARLVEQIANLRKDFDDKTGQIGTSAVWKDLSDDLAEKFEEVTGANPPTDPTKIAPADYVRLCRAVFILEQARDFILLCKAGGRAGALGAEYTQRRDELMLCLRGGGWEELKRAQRLVRQIRRGIFREQVEEQIATKRVEIVSPSVVRQFQAIELRVAFFDKRVQMSAAREEYTCHWRFEYNNQKATGWSVSHFFPFATEEELQPESEEGWMQKIRRKLHWEKDKRQPRGFMPKPYKVTVTFVRDDGFEVPGKIETDIPVRPPVRLKVGASGWIEALRLSLALGIAATALILGAREQVLKMDVFPALITVFLLGFGSDRIKNMFAQRTEAAEEPKQEPKPPAPAPAKQ